VVARANDEYGFLAFASDHGLFTDCEAYYNGDSGIYPGSAADVNKDNTSFTPVRYAVEVRRCSSHDNTLGLSGTGGNSIYIHDNAFFHNATGMSLDSFFPGHPGLPQDHTHITHNAIYANNSNYYTKYVKNGDDGVCNAKTKMPDRGYINGTVCPSVPVPVGTGVFIAGGNYNSIDHDQIYDNWRYGAMLLWVPAELRGAGPPDTFDTSHFNHYVDNSMGTSPTGLKQPNGMEFWWDDEGQGNCWQDNVSTYGVPTSNTVNPAGLPTCTSGGSAFSPGVFAKDAPFVSCTQYDKNSQPNPPGCEWFISPKEPAGRQSGDVVPSGTGSSPTSTARSAAGSATGGGVLASTGLGVGVGIAGLVLLVSAAVIWRAGGRRRAVS